MEETVNEQLVFEESDFADDQTSEQSSPAVKDATEQPTSETQSKESTDGPTQDANESQPGDEIDEFLAKKGIKKDDPEALRKVADMYRNVEKDYGKKSQEKAQLEGRCLWSAGGRRRRGCWCVSTSTAMGATR